LLNGTDENARSHLDASTSNGWTARLITMLKPTERATHDKSTTLSTIYLQERLDQPKKYL